MSVLNPHEKPDTDGEDVEAIRQSAARQWHLLEPQLALGLHIDDLDLQNDAQQEFIAETIVDRIQLVRGAVDRDQLLGEILGDFRQNIGDDGPVRPGVITHGADIANAWLKTIYGRFSEAEIRSIVEDIRANPPVGGYTAPQQQFIDRLVASTASNRELVLALSAIQDDPTVLQNITNTNTNRGMSGVITEARSVAPLAVQHPIAENISVTELDTAIHNLGAALTDIDRARGDWALAQQTHAAAVQAHRRDYARYEREVRAAQTAEATNARRDEQYAHMLALGNTPPPPTYVAVPAIMAEPPDPAAPTFAAFHVGFPLNVDIRTIEENNQRRSEISTLQHQLQTLRREFTTRQAFLVRLGRALRTAGQTNATLGVASPELSTILNIDVDPPVVNLNELRANTNMTDIAEQLARAFPQPAEGAAEPAGSEACWAIIRQRLTNEGLRSDELEKTVQYMQSQIQFSPEAARSVDTLAVNEFPEEDAVADNAAAQRWNRAQNLPRGWFGRVPNTYQTYTNRLQDRLGIQFNAENFRDRNRYRLPRLTNAYFTIKHLVNLPASDPHHLPYSQSIRRLLVRLHAAIIDRAQESYKAAAGSVTAEELARLGITPGMSLVQRLQKANDHLKNVETYYTTNKRTIDANIEHAYQPIQQQITRNATVTTRHNNVMAIPGKIVSPITNHPTASIGAVAGGIAGTILAPGLGTAVGIPVGIAAAKIAVGTFNVANKTRKSVWSHLMSKSKFL